MSKKRGWKSTAQYLTSPQLRRLLHTGASNYENLLSGFVYTLGGLFPFCCHEREQPETVGNIQDLCRYHSGFEYTLSGFVYAKSGFVYE